VRERVDAPDRGWAALAVICEAGSLDPTDARLIKRTNSGDFDLARQRSVVIKLATSALVAARILTALQVARWLEDDERAVLAHLGRRLDQLGLGGRRCGPKASLMCPTFDRPRSHTLAELHAIGYLPGLPRGGSAGPQRVERRLTLAHSPGVPDDLMAVIKAKVCEIRPSVWAVQPGSWPELHHRVRTSDQPSASWQPL
jgi:hypothetical protein